MLKQMEFSSEEIREIDTYCRCMDKSFPHDYFKAKRKGKQRFTSILRSYVYALALCCKERGPRLKHLNREAVKNKLRNFVASKGCQVDTDMVKTVILDIMKERHVIETHGLWIPLQTVYTGDLISALNDALPKYFKPKELERFDRDELVKKEAYHQIEVLLKRDKVDRAKLTERRLETLLKKHNKGEILRAFCHDPKKILQHYTVSKETLERTTFLQDLRSRSSLRSLTDEEIERLVQFGYKYKIIDKGKRSERVIISKR